VDKTDYAFFGAAFFATAFLAGAFFATAFLAGAFFATAFFGAAFFATAFFGAAFFTAFLVVAMLVILPVPHYETKLKKDKSKS